MASGQRQPVKAERRPTGDHASEPLGRGDTLVHVLGHPDCPLDVAAAAADAQVWNCHRFCKLLHHAGLRFVYYGLSGSRVRGGEVVDIGVAEPPWEYGSPRHESYTALLSEALRQSHDARPCSRHLVCSLYGAAHSDVDCLGLPVIEPMVGYDHCWAPYRVFPSYAHQTVIYTLQADYVENTRWFDTVIPHFVDPADYPLGGGSGGYALYLGRNAEDKGISIAEEVCASAGIPLRTVHGGYWGKRKAGLIGDARVVFMPTLYLEPFGYVAIEAQMCGVPVLTTDWGAFAETVEHGVSGFRCRTEAEFLCGLERVGGLDRERIRRRALGRYTIEAVMPEYTDYFDFVWNVHVNGGYYAANALRHAFRR